MKYRVTVKGVAPALAKKMSAVLTDEVNRYESEVSKWNRSVRNMRNSATLREAAREVLARHMGGN